MTLLRCLVSDSAREREVEVSLTREGLATLTVHGLIERCGWPDLDEKECGVVCDGVLHVCGEDVLFATPLSAESVVAVVHVFDVCPEVCGIGQRLVVDALSLQAAQHWLVTEACHDSHSDTAVTAQLAMSLQAVAPSVDNTTTTETPPAPAALAPRDLRQWLQPLGALARMCLFFYLFVSNRSMSDTRKYLLAGAMVAVFLWEIKLWHHIVTWLWNNVVPANAAAHNARQRVEETLSAFSRRATRIPTTPGVSYDLYALTVSVVGSFVPGWHPLPAEGA